MSGRSVDVDGRGVRVNGRSVGVGSAIPDNGLTHRYSAKEQSDASSLLDQTGSKNMSAVGSPQYLSSGINGNPAFQTDGTDDAFSSSLWSISNDSWTVAFVGSFDALNNFKYAWKHGDILAGGFGLAVDNDGKWVVVQDNTNYNGGSEDKNLHTFIVTYGSGTLVVDVDDTTIINTSATDPSPTGESSIGGYINQSRFQALTFGEFLIYDSFKESTERSDIRSYFADEWGV